MASVKTDICMAMCECGAGNTHEVVAAQSGLTIAQPERQEESQESHPEGERTCSSMVGRKG